MFDAHYVSRAFFAPFPQALVNHKIMLRGFSKVWLTDSPVGLYDAKNFSPKSSLVLYVGGKSLKVRENARWCYLEQALSFLPSPPSHFLET